MGEQKQVSGPLIESHIVTCYRSIVFVFFVALIINFDSLYFFAHLCNFSLFTLKYKLYKDEGHALFTTCTSQEMSSGGRVREEGRKEGRKRG